MVSVHFVPEGGSCSSGCRSSTVVNCGAIHCVAVGDANSGKKQLLAAYERADSHNESEFPIEYQTCKVHDNFAYNFIFSGFSGQEKRHNLRRLSYLRPTGVFLVCFSVIDVTQFHNAVTTWVPEVKTNAPNVPFILVGTHADLRDDVRRQEPALSATSTHAAAERHSYVSRQQAEATAKTLRCKYLECSSLTMDGIEAVFNAAIQAAVNGPVAELCRSICMIF